MLPGTLLATLAAAALSAVAQDAGAAPPAPAIPVINIDKTQVDNGGVITVTGSAEPGKPVYLEVWNENKVRGSLFDNKVGQETGQKPNELYISNDLPAFYRILVPKSEQPKLDRFKAEGRGWSCSQALKDTGADVAYRAPSGTGIASHQTSMAASMSGQRGEPLPTLEDKGARKRSMQVMKSRFRSVDKLLVAGIEQKRTAASPRR